MLPDELKFALICIAGFPNSVTPVQYCECELSPLSLAQGLKGILTSARVESQCRNIFSNAVDYRLFAQN